MRERERERERDKKERNRVKKETLRHRKEGERSRYLKWFKTRVEPQNIYKKCSSIDRGGIELLSRPKAR